MTTRRPLSLLGMGGVLIFGVAVSASLVLSPYFWTDETFGQDVPWYFMGRDFVRGVCATVGLLVTIILGLIASRTYGRAVWRSLFPAFIFLSLYVGQGLSVFLFTNRIWEGAASASSQWRSFEDYIFGSSVAAVLTLAVISVVGLRFRRFLNEGGT